MTFYGYNTFSSIFLLLSQSKFFGALVKCYDVHSLAFTVHRTLFFYLTVTECQLVTRCGCNLSIMAFVYFAYILHTAVTKLHCVPFKTLENDSLSWIEF